MPVTQTLTVTQVAGSQDVASNTSKVRIVWVSTQTGQSFNDITKTAYYWIKTPDGVETKYSVSYTLPLATAKTILDKTITVTHKDDGTGTVSVRTWMPTGISAGDVELGPETLTLEKIERASTITDVSNVTLGNACGVKWTPASVSYRYKLKFTMGSWSHTTGVIYPNRTSAYIYTGYKISMAAANQMPNSKTGTMKVTLYTYSDSGATDQVGSADSATFTVTIPNNDSTAPTVTMTLSPVNSLGTAFNGLYIQGKSKVQATISATGKYGATIELYRMGIGSNAYDDPFISDYLEHAGEVVVLGAAQDSRGLANYTEKTISVMAYSKPQILAASGESGVVAARCNASGVLSDSGTYLKIKAKRSYNLLKAGGVQKNFCKIQYRYKPNGGDYSGWVTILSSSSLTSDEVATGALLGGALAVDTTYTVQVQAIDDVGEYSRTTITVPTDKVYWHRDGARRAFAFGGYVEEDNTFSIADGIKFKAKGGGNIDILTLGTKLVATANGRLNLNDIQKPGNYYSPNAETSQYIVNSPRGSAGGFGLRIREMQTSGYVRQEQFYGRTTWVRHWDGSVWSDWLRYLTTTVDETAVSDYVIETGSSGGWTYKKWKGGTYEMFGTFEITPPSSTQRDTLYRTDNMTIAAPFAISSACVSGTAVGFYWITNGGITSDGKITLRLMGTRAFDTATAIEVRLMVVGTYS